MILSRKGGRIGGGAAIFAALIQLVAATSYTQSGSCYDYYSISVTSCADVKTACPRNSCSDINGYVTYTCYSPNSCSGTATLDSSASSTSSTPSSSDGTYNGYEQSGSCYTDHNIKVASCDDLNGGVCNSRSCSQAGSQIKYTCYADFFTCSGTATLSTTASGVPTSGSSDCINGYNLQLTTCAETSSFNDIGCTCFTCAEVNGHITLACSAPFTCSNDFDGPNAASTEPPPELDVANYAVICVVYIGVAVAFAAIAWWMKPKQPHDPSTPKQSMTEKARAFCSPATLTMYVAKKVWDEFVSYVIEPNMRSDGTKTTMCEFWASMNLWVAILSRIGCCCCARPRQPPPNYKPPMRIGSAIYQLFTDACITFSLAFLVGTVVSNSEACSTQINGNFCQQGASTISQTGTSSTSDGLCQSVDLGKTTGAVIVTTVLTKIVAAACGYAEGTGKDNAKRKFKILAAGVLVRVVLLCFGVGYSFALTTHASGSEAAKQRYSTIGAVLGPSWAGDQILSVIEVFGQRVGVVLVYTRESIKKLKADQVISSIVHPAISKHLQSPGSPVATGVDPSDVAFKVINTSTPSAPTLSSMVYETDASPAKSASDR